jgi:hypothetical protein
MPSIFSIVIHATPIGFFNILTHVSSCSFIQMQRMLSLNSSRQRMFSFALVTTLSNVLLFFAVYNLDFYMDAQDLA